MLLEEALNNDTITLKFREKAKGDSSDCLFFAIGQPDGGRGSRREKERKIGEVVIKVSAWR